MSLGDAALSKVLILQAAVRGFSISPANTVVGVQINRQAILNDVHCGSIAQVANGTQSGRCFFAPSPTETNDVRDLERDVETEREKEIQRECDREKV